MPDIEPIEGQPGELPKVPDNDTIDLGAGVTVRISTRYGSEEEIGGILEHPRADSPTGRCSGGFFWVPFDNHPVWRLVSRNPLTLEPSFLCHCGFHGFIREGKWVPA